VKNRMFAIGLATSLGLGATNAWADLEVSASVNIHATADFYTPLSPSGEWITVGSYGRCWRPRSVTLDWRPYCVGHWVWTDCGWYWESDEPWAWACYHYGSWVYDPVNFWVWVPAIEWAPAWVSWRVGGGYIGWAPLPPAGLRVTVAAPQFVFVQSQRFTEPLRPSAVVVNNTTIINQTKVINNVTRETRTVAGAGPRTVVVNNGPGVEVVQQATGRPLKATPIHEVVQRTQGAPQSLGTPGKSEAKSPTVPLERSSPAPGRELTQPQTPRQQSPSAPKERVAPPAERTSPAPKERVAPPAERTPPAPKEHVAPPVRTAPPAKPTNPPKEQDGGKGYGGDNEGKGHGNESEGHGKDKQ